MTYKDLLELLQEQLYNVKVLRDSGEWRPAREAQVNAKILPWDYDKRDLHVTRENWHLVMEALAEGQLRGFDVMWYW